MSDQNIPYWSKPDILFLSSIYCLFSVSQHATHHFHSDAFITTPLKRNDLQGLGGCPLEFSSLIILYVLPKSCGPDYVELSNKAMFSISRSSLRSIVEWATAGLNTVLVLQIS